MFQYQPAQQSNQPNGAPNANMSQSALGITQQFHFMGHPTQQGGAQAQNLPVNGNPYNINQNPNYSTNNFPQAHAPAPAPAPAPVQKPQENWQYYQQQQWQQLQQSQPQQQQQQNNHYYQQQQQQQSQYQHQQQQLYYSVQTQQQQAVPVNAQPHPQQSAYSLQAQAQHGYQITHQEPGHVLTHSLSGPTYSNNNNNSNASYWSPGSDGHAQGGMQMQRSRTHDNSNQNQAPLSHSQSPGPKNQPEAQLQINYTRKLELVPLGTLFTGNKDRVLDSALQEGAVYATPVLVCNKELETSKVVTAVVGAVLRLLIKQSSDAKWAQFERFFRSENAKKALWGHFVLYRNELREADSADKVSSVLAQFLRLCTRWLATTDYWQFNKVAGQIVNAQNSNPQEQATLADIFARELGCHFTFLDAPTTHSDGPGANFLRGAPRSAVVKSALDHIIVLYQPNKLNQMEYEIRLCFAHSGDQLAELVLQRNALKREKNALRKLQDGLQTLNTEFYAIESTSFARLEAEKKQIISAQSYQMEREGLQLHEQHHSKMRQLYGNKWSGKCVCNQV